MSKEIKLTKGYVAIVDDEDFELLSVFRWQVTVNNTTKLVYASRGCVVGKRYTIILMHRQIMNAKKGQFVDHKNLNTLDNRKDNLRFCTLSQNNANRKPKTGTSSNYFGVYYSQYHADRGLPPWISRIRQNGRKGYMRGFRTEIEAAIDHDKQALIVHGEFASLNFPLHNTIK